MVEIFGGSRFVLQDAWLQGRRDSLLDVIATLLFALRAALSRKCHCFGLTFDVEDLFVVAVSVCDDSKNSRFLFQ